MEEWKQIEGYSRYEVSNLGRVRSKRTVLKPCPVRPLNKYYVVNLYRDGETRTPTKHLVHRLVATAFIINPESKKPSKSY